MGLCGKGCHQFFFSQRAIANDWLTLGRRHRLHRGQRHRGRSAGNGHQKLAGVADGRPRGRFWAVATVPPLATSSALAVLSAPTPYSMRPAAANVNDCLPMHSCFMEAEASLHVSVINTLAFLLLLRKGVRANNAESKTEIENCKKFLPWLQLFTTANLLKSVQVNRLLVRSDRVFWVGDSKLWWTFRPSFGNFYTFGGKSFFCNVIFSFSVAQ